jgi:ABC-2 type transport system ATP-binding protein
MKLELIQLEKRFGENEVLKGIGFSVESGRSVGLLGRNGAGKTTTLRIVMDVFAPDGGQVLLDGKPFKRGDYRIGYLPEERGLYPKRLIQDQLAYLGTLRGLNPAKARDEAKKWLGRMELSDYANKKVDTLSKGNQQKIQLAVAMLGDPQIVILDEPFSGLDPVNAMLLKDIVRECIDAGKIVLFSSHQMNYVEEFCQNIVILNQGRIVLDTSIAAHKRSYDRRHILVDVAPGGLDKALSFLRGKGFKAEAQEDLLHVHVNAAEETLPILNAMAEEKIPVEGYRVFEPSLNDIFVEYTGAAI